MISTEVVIVGGGCVGLSVALGLAQQGVKVAVVDASKAPSSLTAADAHLRVSALSVASERFFENLGIWNALQQQRVTAYSMMDVWEQHGFGRITFDAEEIAHAHLGHIVENDNLRFALYCALLDHENASLCFEMKVADVNVSERESVLSLQSEAGQSEIIIASLIVAADGANSFIRQKMNIPLTFWDYNHTAIVANVTTTTAHGACARQVFQPSGPIALLPLWDENQCSLVWSAEPDVADALLQMDSSAFSKKLTAAFDGVLGNLTVSDAKQSFPLRMRYARQWVMPRIALVGDAAHTIHPLAGLGMNLGLLDAACLVEQIVGNHKLGKDIGELKQLRSYERQRKAEAQEYIAAMEGLKRLFSNDNSILKMGRNFGLSFVNGISPFKSMFVKRAMGLGGDLPTLMQASK